jgi:predicted nucleic acid-binding protein
VSRARATGCRICDPSRSEARGGATYLPFAETVVVPGSSGVPLPRCRDPHDQKFLGLADAGQARVLVSGDRALLDLGGRLPFDIEAPERFRTRFG